MKTLSVRQPWATYIAEGLKKLEIRSWQTKYRGPLLISASGKPYKLDDDDGKVVVLPSQVLVCVVDLADCRLITDASESRDEKLACCGVFPGEFAWVLENARMVKPVSHKGKLMLYETPDSLIVPLPPDLHFLDAA